MSEKHPGSSTGKQAWLSYVKIVIRRYPNNLHAIENEAVKSAIKTAKPDELALINAVHIRKVKTLCAAAEESYISYTQAREKVKRFYKAVAMELGLPMSEQEETRRYIEDWHGYILNILSRYPENRHEAERVAISETLNKSDAITSEFIIRAYISRTETAQAVAYSMGIHPATIDHKKTAFFYDLAEALNLPTK